MIYWAHSPAYYATGTTASSMTYTFTMGTSWNPQPADALDICNYLNDLNQPVPGMTPGPWLNDLAERLR